ncbi:MAG: sulfite exporter TauE/SafE family protein [Gemmatimonadaceae bacterium]|nr:sulfite exporter TauE/SafE family protein [Gemmatimonadaceae bacterium]
MAVPNEFAGILLGLGVGVVLGLLGGGGSILAVPIFLYVFQVPAKPAIAMSLAVVSLSAFVGFLGHWRQGSVNLRIGLPFGVLAMASAFATARVSHLVPEAVQLSLFAAFAFTAAIVMLVDSLRTPAAGPPARPMQLTPMVGLEALGVGALTALIGAGGGFLIVPALVYLAGVPMKEAVGSSLLIITLNALSGFAGYIGQVEIDWRLVGSFTGVAAVGALFGTRLNRRVSQVRIKQGFAILILALGSYLLLRRI